MKRLIPIIIFLLVAISASSQIRPSDSLYLWIDFSEDKILIDIPDTYMHYRTLPTMLPNHVGVRTIHTLVPNLPGKPVLVAMLQSELQQSLSPQSREQQLKFLGKVVLLLFYTNNDLNALPAEVINTLKQLTQKDTVKKEAAMVEKWVVMASERTLKSE